MQNLVTHPAHALLPVLAPGGKKMELIRIMIVVMITNKLILLVDKEELLMSYNV